MQVNFEMKKWMQLALVSIVAMIALYISCKGLSPSGAPAIGTDIFCCIMIFVSAAAMLAFGIMAIVWWIDP